MDKSLTHLAAFYHWERTTPDNVFLRQPYGAQWFTLTYAEAGRQARIMATALQDRGLPPGAHVGILSKNCYHWILADLAIMMGGFVSVPFYANLTADHLRDVATQSHIQLLFVGKLETWEEQRAGVPDNVGIIRFPHYAGNSRVTEGTDWDELQAHGSPLEGEPLPEPDDTWTLLYTSGTTGTPKGAVHTYRNPTLLIEAERRHHFLGLFRMQAAQFFSFLPLNHVAERMIVEVAAFVTGGTISFGESIDTFARNLQDTQPTLFFAVPRIWSKFQLAIHGKIPPPLFRFLMSVPGLNTWFKRTLRHRLGLGRAEILLTGASITPQFLKDWYRRLGLDLREVYGSTEITGGVTLMPAGQDRPGTVGRPVDETEIRIDETTGEILAKVPWTMTEYFENPDLTAEVLRDGWYHTGD
ncbi:MAG: AMP-binding protein, partial [Lewinella sp.]|nr:AMP-binding protein [Lewinella sp.]